MPKRTLRANKSSVQVDTEDTDDEDELLIQLPRNMKYFSTAETDSGNHVLVECNKEDSDEGDMQTEIDDDGTSPATLKDEIAMQPPGNDVAVADENDLRASGKEDEEEDTEHGSLQVRPLRRSGRIRQRPDRFNPQIYEQRIRPIPAPRKSRATIPQKFNPIEMVKELCKTSEVNVIINC